MPSKRPKALQRLAGVVAVAVGGGLSGITCGTAMGNEKFPVPVNRSGENFSPSPLTAPPPFGSEITEPSAAESAATMLTG